MCAYMHYFCCVCASIVDVMLLNNNALGLRHNVYYSNFHLPDEALCKGRKLAIIIKI